MCVRACLNWRGGSCLSLNVCLVEERATAPRGHKTLEQVMKSWQRDDRYNVTRRPVWHRHFALSLSPTQHSHSEGGQNIYFFSLKLIMRNSTGLSDTTSSKHPKLHSITWLRHECQAFAAATSSSDLREVKGGHCFQKIHYAFLT